MIFKYNINMTPLHHACENGHFEIVQLLLSQPNIDINCKTIQMTYFMLFKFDISWDSNWFSCGIFSYQVVKQH